MRWAPRGLFSLHPEFQIKFKAVSTEVLVGYTKAFPQGRIADHSRAMGSPPSILSKLLMYLTSSSPGKLSVQKRRWMVAGAAGAPGLLAARALSRGGESAIILHLRMEVPPVQEKMCRPSLAEGR